MNNIREFLSKALEDASIGENQSLTPSEAHMPRLPKRSELKEVEVLMKDYFQGNPHAPVP